MARRIKSKPIKKISKKMRTKTLVLFSCVILAFAGIIGAIISMDITKGNIYTKKLLSKQNADYQTIPFQRGDITDRNGTVLATSEAAYRLILDVSIMDDDDLEPTAKALAEVFDDIDEDEILDYMQNNRDSAYKILEKQISYEQLQPWLEKEEEKAYDEEGKEVSNHINGVSYETVYLRNYPFGQLASSLIGFVSGDNSGTIGLEKYYNDELNGVNGRKYGYLNSDNLFEQTVINAENGDNLVSTIDANIQMIVEEKIQEFYDTYSDNWREGGGFEKCAVMIENPQTGEILAMANYPSFDLNDPRNLTVLYSDEEIDAMTGQEQSNQLAELWQNYCVSQEYEPGSVQKPLTVACGLETGTITDDMTFECDGREYFKGVENPVKCVNVNGHGTETVRKALMDSCNDALMQMSYKIGKENFVRYQNIFGFGQLTGIDLPDEKSLSTLIFYEDNMTELNLATNAFGQNFDCTMVQMCSAISSLINNGYYYQPHVVKRITDEDGNTVSEIEPTLVRQTVSEETSELVKSYMQSVVDEGTGNYAKVDGYSMGGKTGTAEKLPRADKNYLVSFCGFAPYDDPQLVIYCIIDTPNAEDQAHSSYAQNLVREILKEVFPYMNIYPDEETTGVNADYDITGNVPPTYEAKEGGGAEAQEAASGEDQSADSTGDDTDSGDDADSADENQ